jgi:hypothetical protein
MYFRNTGILTKLNAAFDKKAASFILSERGTKLIVNLQLLSVNITIIPAKFLA